MRLAIVINYCTSDFRFLHLCAEEALKCSSQVIISVCDHFFNGEKEDRALLERSYRENPSCRFIEYAYDPNTPYGIYCPLSAQDEDWIHHWHSTGRYVGYHFVDEETTHVLFLDVDEILESARFNEWLKCLSPSLNAVRLSGYFYFRESAFRALSRLPTSLLVKRQAIPSAEMLLNIFERKGLFDEILGKKILNEMGVDGEPLLHHYSWVRTKEELLFKVSSWGHHKERDWKTLIGEEFSQEFRGVDTIYGMHYETVEPVHDPLQDREPKPNVAAVDNVTRVSREELMRRGITLQLK